MYYYTGLKACPYMTFRKRNIKQTITWDGTTDYLLENADQTKRFT